MKLVLKKTNPDKLPGFEIKEFYEEGFAFTNLHQNKLPYCKKVTKNPKNYLEILNLFVVVVCPSL